MIFSSFTSEIVVSQDVMQVLNIERGTALLQITPPKAKVTFKVQGNREKPVGENTDTVLIIEERRCYFTPS